MSASQFTIYSSTDSGAPILNGTTGSLLNVFDLCLVSGFGSQLGAGWTKPIANSGFRGCYRNTSGTSLTLMVIDNGSFPTVTTGSACGWEILTSLTGNIGSGTNQFPLPTQQLTTGIVPISKSITSDATPRYWRMYADAYTFYFFSMIDVPTPPGNYLSFWFGDIFSLAGSADTFRCMINGGTANTSASNLWDKLSFALNNGPPAPAGLWAARPWTTVGGSVAMQRLGDMALTQAATNPLVATGIVNVPNLPDQSAIFSPIRVSDNPYNSIRGRMRGLYHVCHPSSSFYDGQILQGTNEYINKTFQIIKQGPAGGILAIEISATVETN